MSNTSNVTYSIATLSVCKNQILYTKQEKANLNSLVWKKEEIKHLDSHVIEARLALAMNTMNDISIQQFCLCVEENAPRDQNETWTQH